MSSPENNPSSSYEQLTLDDMLPPDTERTGSIQVEEHVLLFDGIKEAAKRLREKLLDNPDASEANPVLEAENEPDNTRLWPALKDAYTAVRQKRSARRNEPSTEPHDIHPDADEGVEDTQDSIEPPRWEDFLDYDGVSEFRHAIEYDAAKKVRDHMINSGELVDDIRMERELQEKQYDKILPFYFGLKPSEVYKIPHKVIKQLRAQIFDLTWDELDEVYSEGPSAPKITEYKKGELAKGIRTSFIFDEKGKFVKTIKKPIKTVKENKEKPDSSVFHEKSTEDIIGRRLYRTIQQDIQERLSEASLEAKKNGIAFDKDEALKTISSLAYKETVANYFRVDTEDLDSGLIPEELQEKVWELLDKTERSLTQEGRKQTSRS